MFRSADVVIEFLQKVDPPAAERARLRYGCFDHIGRDEQAYGSSVHWNLRKSCEEDVVHQLADLHQKAADFEAHRGVEEDEYFYARQNAMLVRSAERYYRSMFSKRDESWNIRDEHMAGSCSLWLQAHVRSNFVRVCYFR